MKMTPSQRLLQARRLYAAARRIEECAAMLSRLETSPPPYYSIFAKSSELSCETAKIKREIEMLEGRYDRIIQNLIKSRSQL